MKKTDAVQLINALAHAEQDLRLLIEVQRGVLFEATPGRSTHGTDYLRAEGVLTMLQTVRRSLVEGQRILGERR
jgi:hypothetical protein